MLFATYLCGIVESIARLHDRLSAVLRISLFGRDIDRHPIIQPVYWPRFQRWSWQMEERWRVEQGGEGLWINVVSSFDSVVASLLCTVMPEELRCKLKVMPEYGFDTSLHSYPNHPCQVLTKRKSGLLLQDSVICLKLCPKWFYEEMMQSHSSPGRRLKTMQIPWQKVSWYAAADNDASPRPLEYFWNWLNITTHLWGVTICSEEVMRGWRVTHVCDKTKGSCKLDATLVNNTPG